MSANDLFIWNPGDDIDIVDGDAGIDTLGCMGNVAALIRITADGGPGDDTIFGSTGNDLLIGGGSVDAQADAMPVNGTGQPDTIHIAANAGAVEVSG